MTKKDILRPLSQIADAIAREKYGDEGYLYIAKELWEARFAGQNKLPPLLNGFESDRAYLADLVHAAAQEIQALIECLKDDGLITLLDPISQMPTVIEEGAFVSEQEVRSLVFDYYKNNKDRIKTEIRKRQAVEVFAQSSEGQRPESLSQSNSNMRQLVPGDNSIEWPACFPNVGHEALEKTFECGKWKSYTERAKRNGLHIARIEGKGRGKYNLYLAAMWWFDYTKPAKYDLARLQRRLADNLLPEYKYLKDHLTGELV